MTHGAQCVLVSAGGHCLPTPSFTAFHLWAACHLKTHHYFSSFFKKTITELDFFHLLFLGLILNLNSRCYISFYFLILWWYFWIPSQGLHTYTSDSKHWIVSTNLINMFTVHSGQIIDKKYRARHWVLRLSASTSLQIGTVWFWVTPVNCKSWICPWLILWPWHYLTHPSLSFSFYKGS